jgi:hypothetical protein
MNAQEQQMTETGIRQADEAFSRQVSAQVSRIAGELNRLDQLLSAGMVDRRVVAEFRDAVGRVRKTSRHVQCWMDGNLHALSSTLIEERIETASHLVTLLASDLQASNETFANLTHLRDSLQKLDRVLAEGPAR